MDPGDLHLPAVLDPVLTYLADALPFPLYHFILNFLSHCLALLSAIRSLVVSLVSRSPAEWDAPTVLPPLISLFAAYLALASIYRTTTWMIRTGLWFVKWGIILGALVAGLGWYIGANQVGGIVNSGLIPRFGGLVLDTINGYGRNAIGGERESRVRRSRSRSKSTQRPRAWESFDLHREWQYSEDQAETEQGSNLGSLFDNLMGMAGQILKEETWWLGLRKVMDDGSDQAVEENDQSQGKTRSKSRSR